MFHASITATVQHEGARHTVTYSQEYGGKVSRADVVLRFRKACAALESNEQDLAAHPEPVRECFAAWLNREAAEGSADYANAAQVAEVPVIDSRRVRRQAEAAAVRGGFASVGAVLVCAVVMLAAAVLLGGCVAQQEITPGAINNAGAAGAASTIVDADGMTVHTPDGAPNLVETTDFRAQSAVPGSAMALVTAERTAAVHSNANVNIGSAVWEKYGEGGELLERVTLEDFATGDRAEIIGADNESVQLWAQLVESMTAEQRAVYDSLIEAGVDAVAAAVQALAPVPSVPGGGGGS